MTVETRTEPIAAPRVKTTADVLRHAARIIEEQGWCQHVLTDEAGRVCARGAMGIAGGFSPRRPGKPKRRRVSRTDPRFLLILDADATLARYLGDDGPQILAVHSAVVDFNNAPGRTAAEVIAALNAAADAAEAA